MPNGVHGEKALYKVGFSNFRYITKFFYLHQSGNLVLIVLKIVEDMLTGASTEIRVAFLTI